MHRPVRETVPSNLILCLLYGNRKSNFLSDENTGWGFLRQGVKEQIIFDLQHKIIDFWLCYNVVLFCLILLTVLKSNDRLCCWIPETVLEKRTLIKATIWNMLIWCQEAILQCFQWKNCQTVIKENFSYLKWSSWPGWMWQVPPLEQGKLMQALIGISQFWP